MKEQCLMLQKSGNIVVMMNNLNSLKERVDRLIIKNKLLWIRKGPSITVSLVSETRKHRVRMSVDDKFLHLRSVVLSAAEMNAKRRREIIYRAWRKNKFKELVAFSLDPAGNLIGTIDFIFGEVSDRQLLEYIERLAIEADRFEYKLTGQDRQ